jgi:hypothetical protein
MFFLLFSLVFLWEVVSELLEAFNSSRNFGQFVLPSFARSALAVCSLLVSFCSSIMDSISSSSFATSDSSASPLLLTQLAQCLGVLACVAASSATSSSSPTIAGPYSLLSDASMASDFALFQGASQLAPL